MTSKNIWIKKSSYLPNITHLKTIYYLFLFSWIAKTRFKRGKVSWQFIEFVIDVPCLAVWRSYGQSNSTFFFLFHLESYREYKNTIFFCYSFISFLFFFCPKNWPSVFVCDYGQCMSMNPWILSKSQLCIYVN